MFVLQEAIDRLATLKQKDNQIDQLQIETARLRNFEENFENVQVSAGMNRNLVAQPLRYFQIN